MKYKIIANPAAGKGKGQHMIPKIQEKLASYGLDFDLICTERPWHAAELAGQAAEQGYEIVVAAGGDGTFNEVLNGLMRARQNGAAKPRLGMICIGRGNDFAFGAGIPTGWEEGCQALVDGKPHGIDVGRLSSDCLEEARYFGNGVGIGFDASVNIQATKIKIGGFLGYMIAALRTLLLHFHSPLLRIECDGEIITQPSIMVSIMNGRRMGGGFYMTPDSVISDGALDLCIAHKVSRLTILLLISRFMKGTQAGHWAIRFVRAHSITITAQEGGLPMHLDGETVCIDGRHITVETVPQAIEILRLPEGR